MPFQPSQAGRPFEIRETPYPPSSGGRIIHSSDGRGWTDMASLIVEDIPHEGSVKAAPYLWLTFSMRDAKLHSSISGTKHKLEIPRGAVSVTNSSVRVDYRTIRPSLTCHAWIRPEVAAEVANEMYGRSFDRFDVSSYLGQADKVLSHVMRSLIAMLREPDNGSFRSDYLARTIMARVLAAHATVLDIKAAAGADARLSEHQLRQIRAFLEANLSGEFQSSDLAASVGLSRTSFFERFAKTTRQTPNQYLQSLRVERAKQLLRDGRLPLTGVAEACGFADLSHMTRFFKRHTGMSPGQYRNAFQ